MLNPAIQSRGNEVFTLLNFLFTNVTYLHFECPLKLYINTKNIAYQC